MVQWNCKKVERCVFIMENKKNGTGKTVAIVILVLLVLGLGGYIVYDKTMTKESSESDGTVQTEKKVEEPTLLTNDEALEIGKDLYIKTRDIAYNQGNKMQVDTSVCYSNENGQMNQTTCSDFTVNKVSDVSFKNNFTTNGLKQYEQKATEYGGGGFVVYNGDYYIKPYKWGPFNGPWDTDATKFTVKQINENNIVLEATETFDTETINTTFTIAKENNQWKMDDYTDAGYLIWSR